mgnify:FL=1
MAAKKGKIPAHVTKKEFFHPDTQHPIIYILERIEDPRKPSQFFRHCLTSVLFMVIAAVICGAKDWPQIVVASQGMADWLSSYVDMSGGIPCERTFKNLFNAIKPEAMEQALRDIAELIRKKIPGEVVCFDGQTERSTGEKHLNLGGIHLLNAWSADNGICIGQLKVDDKSNEITAMPELMESLDLKNTIITADALNTQKKTVTKAIDCGADYLLPVKGNQRILLEEITSAFNQLDIERAKAEEHWETAVLKAKEHRDHLRLEKLMKEGPRSCGASFWESIEKGHGRIEIRSCMTMLAKDLPSKEEWKGLNTIARICRIRKIGDKEESETTYYIGSLEPDAELVASVARKHWGVENNLHGRLDIVFRQDDSRYRDRVGARNLAVVRKIALNAVSKETTMKGGIATKQYAASFNPVYRDKILKNLF